MDISTCFAYKRLLDFRYHHLLLMIQYFTHLTIIVSTFQYTTDVYGILDRIIDTTSNSILAQIIKLKFFHTVHIPKQKVILPKQPPTPLTPLQQPAMTTSPHLTSTLPLNVVQKYLNP